MTSSLTLPLAAAEVDVKELLTRLDKLEKTQNVVSKSLSLKPYNTVDKFFDSLTATQISLNARTVELCAIASMFIVGCIIGWSLLDRLWLLGGLSMSYWSSGAVHRDSRGGMICRRIGVSVAHIIRDLQEKYNQMIIFYRTGRLAYESHRIWDQFDREWGVQRRVDDWKRKAVLRLTSFNTAFQEYGVTEQFNDVIAALMQAPTKAAKLDEEYGLTSGILNYSNQLLTGTIDTFQNMIGFNKKNKAKRDTHGRYMFTNGKSKSTLRLSFKRPKKLYRPRLNPWEFPFSSVMRQRKSKG
jgi:hypothetical protein